MEYVKTFESFLGEALELKGALSMRDLQDRNLEIKFNKFGLGYSWTDMYGKEKYEEGTFEDAKDFNEILERISEEIVYQEKTKTK